MQPEKPKLVIHTAIQPEAAAQPKTAKIPKIAWRVLPKRAVRSAARRPGRRLRTPGQRLLRNTAIACALMLGVMATTRIDQPWSNQVAQTVSNIVNMRVDLDDSLGQLRFVQRILPDTALVFWNMGGADTFARPVSGSLAHAYDEAQPWQLYQVDGTQPVYAATAGTIAAATENALGEWTLLIDHEDGLQTVYACLDKIIVRTGQAVERGAQIGVTADDAQACLYFEMREHGVPADPAARMNA